jgi:hypothetical protein
MMVINNKYEIKQIVYLITDPDQYPRIITSIKVHDGGELLYETSCGKDSSNHYEFEISTEKSYN